MVQVIGNKNKFAIGVKLIRMKPAIWGNTCLWINGDQIGDITDENVLAPFIRALVQLSIKYISFENYKLKDLSCTQMFYTIYPFYNEPEKLFSLTPEETDKYESFENHSLYLGENFDSWSLSAVLKEKQYFQFIWVHYPKRDADSYEVRNNIKCFDVPLIVVRDVCKEFCKLIPDQYWPSMIEKFH